MQEDVSELCVRGVVVMVGGGLAKQTEKPHMKSNTSTLELPFFYFLFLNHLQMWFGSSREGLDSTRFSHWMA